MPDCRTEKEKMEQLFIGAIQDGSLERVKFCIERGEKRHITDYLPFQYSAASGNLDVLKYLVANGAGIYLDPYDKSACWGMVYAANNTYKETVQYFCDHIKNIKDFEPIFNHPELSVSAKRLYKKCLAKKIAFDEKEKMEQGLSDKKTKKVKKIIIL